MSAPSAPSTWSTSPRLTPSRLTIAAATSTAHNPQITLMRTTADENARMGRWIGERLNAMEGPVRFLIPERGVSALDAPGQPFHDPDADAALFEALERTVRPTANRQLLRLPLHINDPAFAAALAQQFTALHGSRPSRAGGEAMMAVPGFTRRTCSAASTRWPRAASRSSAAAPAPGCPRNARRPAASTSS